MTAATNNAQTEFLNSADEGRPAIGLLGALIFLKVIVPVKILI